MKEKKLTVYNIVFMGLLAAIMCILGPLSLPIGPVPISLTNFVVYFAVYVLGTKLGTGSLCLYLILGAVGLPVFSGYAGGLAKLTGPTGGYLIGFIFMALIGGYVIEKSNRNFFATIAAWVVGTAVDYAFGTAWFIFIMHMPLGKALMLCVVPFIIGDLIKIVVGTILGREVHRGLSKAGMFSQHARTEG